MGEKMKKAMLISGLIRDEDKFTKFLDVLIDKSIQIPIYYSTWVGELDKYPAIEKKLLSLDAIIIEQKQPDLILKGHVLHQMVTWDVPLNILADDVFIYKTRPDFADFDSFQTFLQYRPRPVEKSIPGVSLPRYKFLISGLFAAQPFYINDITFAGYAKDLRRLTRLSFMDLIRYFRFAPEQMIWGPQFIEPASILYTYFKSNVGLIFNDSESIGKNISALKKCKTYHYALATYFNVINAAFDFFKEEKFARDLNLIANHTAEEWLWSPVSAPYLSHNIACSTNHINVAAYYTGILDGVCKPSEFGESIMQASNHLLDPNRSLGHDAFSDDIGKYTRAVEEEMGIYGSRVMRNNGRRKLNIGANPEWTQANLGTPLTQSLEEEINHLRRILNETEKKLSLAMFNK
jgi:hypothetical protein